jgi:hypothetical protein
MIYHICATEATPYPGTSRPSTCCISATRDGDLASSAAPSIGAASAILLTIASRLSKLVVIERSCCLISSVLVKPSEFSQRQSRLKSLQYWQAGRRPVHFVFLFLYWKHALFTGSEFFLVRTVLAVFASFKTLSLVLYMMPSLSLPPTAPLI